MSWHDVRRDRLTRPIHAWAKKVLPALFETECDALDAGEVWWDAELFAGDPDFSKLQAVKAPELTAEEREFLEGPTARLCALLDDWKINWEYGDLPPEAWELMRKGRFFGMIIPKEYGGLGISAFAAGQPRNPRARPPAWG